MLLHHLCDHLTHRLPPGFRRHDMQQLVKLSRLEVLIVVLIQRRPTLLPAQLIEVEADPDLDGQRSDEVLEEPPTEEAGSDMFARHAVHGCLSDELRADESAERHIHVEEADDVLAGRAQNNRLWEVLDVFVTYHSEYSRRKVRERSVTS
ncbi:MAG: hypothetical protein M1819_003604 [Sarea resinae]|nr:MAG: hypothetical protein M1819_003604 [Sarea resinae]